MKPEPVIGENRAPRPILTALACCKISTSLPIQLLVFYVTTLDLIVSIMQTKYIFLLRWVGWISLCRHLGSLSRRRVSLPQVNHNCVLQDCVQWNWGNLSLVSSVILSYFSCVNIAYFLASFILLLRKMCPAGLFWLTQQHWRAVVCYALCDVGTYVKRKKCSCFLTRLHFYFVQFVKILFP